MTKKCLSPLRKLKDAVAPSAFALLALVLAVSILNATDVTAQTQRSGHSSHPVDTVKHTSGNTPKNQNHVTGSMPASSITGTKAGGHQGLSVKVLTAEQVDALRKEKKGKGAVVPTKDGQHSSDAKALEPKAASKTANPAPEAGKFVTVAVLGTEQAVHLPVSTAPEGTDGKANTEASINQGPAVLYVLDGKEITYKQMLAVDRNTVEAVQFVNGTETAGKQYGANARNGVVLIKTSAAKTAE